MNEIHEAQIKETVGILESTVRDLEHAKQGVLMYEVKRDELIAKLSQIRSCWEDD